MQKKVEQAQREFSAKEDAARSKLLRVASKHMKSISGASDDVAKSKLEPSALPKAAKIKVVYSGTKKDCSGVHVALVSPKGIVLSANTGPDGCAEIKLKPGVKSYRLLCGGPGIKPFMKRAFQPESTNKIIVTSHSKGGSAVFDDESGFVQGLAGRVDFMSDDSGAYVYGDNIAIEGGKAQPVDIRVGKWVSMEDADSHVFRLRAVWFPKPSAAVLVEYERVK